MANVDIAQEYRLKFGQDIPTRSLARIMAHDGVVKSIDEGRDALRYLEGKKGAKDRKSTAKRNMQMQQERPKNPYALPQVEERNREPFVLPLGCNNILVLSDLHIPYYHIPSVEKAITHGLDNNVNCIILLGDVLDNHNLSSFEKDPTRRSQEEEISICKAFLVRLRELFPNIPIYWAKGNHDIRFELYIKRNAKDLATLKNFQLESVLALHEQNIILVDDKTILKAGKLMIHHGHYLFGKWGSENPGKALVDKTGGDFMIGHLHRHITFERLTVSGRKRAFILGCLSEVGLNVDYNPIVNQYRRGFARIIVEKDGNFDVEMISCD
jgi:predicted phosphodiesterase